MRLRPIVAVLACVTAFACNGIVTESGQSPPRQGPTDEGFVGDGQGEPPRKRPPHTKPRDDGDDGEEPQDQGDPSTIDEDTFAEEVYVFMQDHTFGLWMCTGTLVSKDTVLTAAHCLDTTMFDSYFIVAPNAPNRVERTASNPRVFGGSFEDVANPDIGILTLDSPITLPRYAVLTDVVAEVTATTVVADEDAGAKGSADAASPDASTDAGAQLLGAAFVRESQDDAESPLAWTNAMPVSSTVQYGYEHGFGTPMYSKGGDSGAGLFLVESGVRTHKLIGVERQPEPSRNLDHFTRIDAEFLAWFAAHTTP